MRDMSNQAEKFVQDDPRPATHTPGSPRQPDSTMPMLEDEDQWWLIIKLIFIRLKDNIKKN